MNTVVVKTFDNYFSANILLTRLQHEGINCFLRDEHTITIDPLLTNALGGIKLAVAKEDAEKAGALLDEYEHEQMQHAKCRICGNTGFQQVIKQSSVNRITAFFTKLFSAPPPPNEYIYQCETCGHQTFVLPASEADPD